MSNISYSSTNLTLLAADNSLNDSAGLLPLLVVGDGVELAGFSLLGNNGRATVVSCTASKLVLSGRTLSTEPWVMTRKPSSPPAR